MKKLLIIGIGAGDPEYVTMQAVNALNQVDVFFVMDKGPAKGKLVALRKEIIERYVKDRDYRVVDVPSPERKAGEADYVGTVEDLNRDKQQVFERLIAHELHDGECGAFLVWGDPSLYDSTMRIVDAIARSGQHAFDYQVIPGISSVQALAAKHRVALNAIGRPLVITNGRTLCEAFPDGIDSAVVMLDAQNAYRQVSNEALDIYWGAYVGTADEILVAGKLGDVIDEIERVRADARQRHGWIMDTYLLKRRRGGAHE
ncbi:precorrin-6A synthase (deacetylating) [Paraburkholderia rhizosphaerae]|uniref:Precorrin-6A synthase (Deacetylating) n=1 Tax=Paraburkholderia rhizosphaerae TaxID=480658 RepID=A0A4R8LGG8_9BURK|nr:precorrin-6A synthase (deacetylating) [Paraburkholderia rhizosphaerae]TDY42197.1 precorrin-6A synthase (deacetylating) [Paraburkholderia rhizosphaerae]